MRTIDILAEKYVPHLDPTNPFYCRHLIYIYTIYVSEKLGAGGRGAYFKTKNINGPHYLFFDRKQNGLKTCFNDAHAQ